jgi:2,4-dienoyl-CoA reductase-like NADH-dependent reductase (Old Yellow Enzyme family)
LIEGKQTVSSSDIPIAGPAVNGEEYSAHPPRPMTVEEIKEVTADWAAASKRCIEDAGFDGVEIHGYKAPLRSADKG